MLGDDKPNANVDAGSFQVPLAKLAEVMVQKLWRDGAHHLNAPAFVGQDMAMMVRHALSTYELLFYINADEHRQNDCSWRVAYGVAGMPLVRSLIDCLYNVTAILQAPAEKGRAYRISGLARTMNDLDNESRPFRQPDTDHRRSMLENFIRNSGFTLEEVEASRQTWPTLGQYIKEQGSGRSLTEHQKFLKTFTHWEWRQYSALSHSAYEAFIRFFGPYPLGVYYTSDFQPHEMRRRIEDSYHIFLSTHIARAATLLLCIITELQAYCRFEGARISERCCELWKSLIPLPEASELYNGRYQQVMKLHRMEPE